MVGYVRCVQASIKAWKRLSIRSFFACLNAPSCVQVGGTKFASKLNWKINTPESCSSWVTDNSGFEWKKEQLSGVFIFKFNFDANLVPPNSSNTIDQIHMKIGPKQAFVLELWGSKVAGVDHDGPTPCNVGLRKIRIILHLYPSLCLVKNVH